MKKKLFQEAFKKAENQCGNNTKHGLSSHLERVFSDDLKFSVSKITFIRYYEKYIENGSNNSNNPSSDLLNKISEYLGCNNYEDFVSKNSLQNVKENVTIYLGEDSKKLSVFKTFIQKNRVSIISVGSLLLIGFIIFNSITQQRWMVWEIDHYEEVKFDAKKYDLGQLKLYDEDRINDLKKITPDCDTHFFDSYGEVKVWYGKNSRKELEYFTSFGLHPETGKTLAPITVYMIRKHICKEY